jgi:carbonic anhydrase/acetyltransferase-like protein (isoleucine patch superfamily)
LLRKLRAFEMAIYQIGAHTPRIDPGAYISEHAVIIGDVEIAEGASVWPGAVLRGDNAKIRIGRNANVQDGAVIHADQSFPVDIGAGVSVGHLAMLHGCTVGANCLVGIQAVVLNGATIASDSLIGAGSLIAEGRVFEAGSLIVGSPGRVVRTLGAEAIVRIRANAIDYRDRARTFVTGLVRIV